MPEAIASYIEALPVQISRLDQIVIEERNPPDALPRERWCDLRNDPARPDAEHAAFRECRLIESRDAFLAI
jgi:hypothetical protein